MAQVARGAATGARLIGFMGAGKSTVAGELADALGVTALDSDALLEERLGHSIARGVRAATARPSFRAAEEELVCELLDDAGPGRGDRARRRQRPSERVRAALEPHLTVLLDVDPDARLGAGRQPTRAASAARPLARDREAFRRAPRERRALYEELADAFLPALARGAAPRVLGRPARARGGAAGHAAAVGERGARATTRC